MGRVGSPTHSFPTRRSSAAAHARAATSHQPPTLRRGAVRSNNRRNGVSPTDSPCGLCGPSCASVSRCTRTCPPTLAIETCTHLNSTTVTRRRIPDPPSPSPFRSRSFGFEKWPAFSCHAHSQAPCLPNCTVQYSFSYWLRQDSVVSMPTRACLYIRLVFQSFLFFDALNSDSDAANASCQPTRPCHPTSIQQQSSKTKGNKSPTAGWLAAAAAAREGLPRSLHQSTRKMSIPSLSLFRGALVCAHNTLPSSGNNTASRAGELERKPVFLV